MTHPDPTSRGADDEDTAASGRDLSEPEHPSGQPEGQEPPSGQTGPADDAARTDDKIVDEDEDDDEAGRGEDRGFFGRIIDAFAPPAPASDAPPAAGNGTPVIRGLPHLRRMRVEDVAIPTVEIVAVPDDIDIARLVETFREHGVTRIPVYRGTLDHPLGLVHLKDFALKHGFDGTGDAFDLPALVRPLIYAPPSMPASVLLTKMQADRMHMALVIDEYGGVDGLVTIEDLIEQIVGEIEDEHDTDDDLSWTVERPGVYLALSRTPLDAFEAEIGRSVTDPASDEEIDTLGGLVFTLIGRVPTRGEVIDHPAGLQFEIVDADPRRIKRMRVRTGAGLTGTDAARAPAAPRDAGARADAARDGGHG